ncbi:hypothetical protein ABKN59_003506 [Abortiporus biennis]
MGYSVSLLAINSAVAKQSFGSRVKLLTVTSHIRSRQLWYISHFSGKATKIRALYLLPIRENHRGIVFVVVFGYIAYLILELLALPLSTSGNCSPKLQLLPKESGRRGTHGGLLSVHYLNLVFAQCSGPRCIPALLCPMSTVYAITIISESPKLGFLPTMPQFNQHIHKLTGLLLAKDLRLIFQHGDPTCSASFQTRLILTKGILPAPFAGLLLEIWILTFIQVLAESVLGFEKLEELDLTFDAFIGRRWLCTPDVMHLCLDFLGDNRRGCMRLTGGYLTGKDSGNKGGTVYILLRQKGSGVS